MKHAIISLCIVITVIVGICFCADTKVKAKEPLPNNFSYLGAIHGKFIYKFHDEHSVCYFSSSDSEGIRELSCFRK